MDQRVRILTYNVRYFGNALGGLASTPGIKRRIAARILALDPLPDVICLQEVETLSLRSSVASRSAHPGETQLEQFMARLEQACLDQRRPFPYEAYYFRAHTYRFGEMRPIYTTGLAVLVNRERLHVAEHNVESPHHITHHHVERWKDRKQSRICAHLRLEDRRHRSFHVFNTHLSLPTPFAKAFWATRAKMGFGSNQLEEARALARFVFSHAGDAPFIVCGDFNSPPASPVYHFLTEEIGLVGAQEALGQIDPMQRRGFPTAGFMHLRMHLDHLFSGGPLEWTDLDDTRPFSDPQSPFRGLSDHVPLIGRFVLVN